MESDSRFSYGGGPSRVDRPLDQFMTSVPVHSTLQARPYRMQQAAAMESGVAANQIDLTSAVAHELRRANSVQPGWHAWSQPFGGSLSSHEPDTGFQLPYGSFLSHQQAGAASRHVSIPQYIPHFDEAGLQGPAMPPVLAMARVESTMESYSPWIDRMMQSDVKPTPCPSGLSLGNTTSLRLAQSRAVGEVSCVASQTVDPPSCHSSDLQQRSEKSMRSTFRYRDPQHESTVELSADLCTDDEDLETHPMDVRRKRRMLSNRASAQRSRQRRQERLDKLEVLTAQLRVENSTLQKKLSAAIQLAKKSEDQNTKLVRKVDRLSKELEGNKKARKPTAAFDQCARSQNTTCASSCDMVGGRLSVDPNLMRDGNLNDGASSPSLSPRSPGWPSGGSPTENEGEMDAVSNGNGAEVSLVRKSLSACRMGSKKRTHEQSEAAAAASFGGSHSASLGNHMGCGSLGYNIAGSQPSRPRLTTSSLELSRPFSHEVCNPLGLYPSSLKEDSNLDCLEADRWLEFADCFM